MAAARGSAKLRGRSSTRRHLSPSQTPSQWPYQRDPHPGEDEFLADPCFDAKSKASFYREDAQRNAGLFDVYQNIFNECSSGAHHLVCVSRALYADNPREYLSTCDSKMGPDPIGSGAVCHFAQQRRDEFQKLATNFQALSAQMDVAFANCKTTPLACVALSDVCLEAPDVNQCFRECLKTGSMTHAMVQTTTSPPYGPS